MCGYECCISDKSIYAFLLSWHDQYLKNPKIKAKMLKTEGLVKKHITYMKHIKFSDATWMSYLCQSIWYVKGCKCVHILGLIVHCHTGNVSCGAVLTVHVSIFLTNKQIISIQTQHPQYGFTFIISLCVVLLMVEFRWNTRKYVTSVNKNLQQTNLNIYTPEKS